MNVVNLFESDSQSDDSMNGTGNSGLSASHAHVLPEVLSNSATNGSKEGYQMILESIHDGYFEADLTGRLTYLNEGLVRILGGTSKSDLLDVEITKFTDKQNAKRLQEVANRVFTTGESVPSFIYKTRRCNGDWYDADISVALMKDDQSTPIGFCGIIRDVTERGRAEKLLRESEERFRTLAETASDAILTIDESGIIVFANSALHKIFGYAHGEVIGQGIERLIPESLRARYKTSLANYINTGRRTTSWKAVEWGGLRSDGKEIPIELSLGEFFSNGRRYFTGIARDISNRKQTNTLLAGQVKVLKMIATGASLYETLDAIIGVFEEVSQASICSILLLSESDQTLHHGSALNLPEEYVRAIDGVSIGPSVGSCGTAAYTKKIVIVEDIAQDPLWADYRALALKSGLQACWSVPIFSTTRQVLGTFASYYRSIAKPTQAEIDLIEMMAHLASIAIECSKSEERLRKSEARFRALIEKNADGIALTDENGVFIYASPSTYRILGYESSEIIGKTAVDRIHPDDWQSLNENGYALAGKHGSSTTVQYRVRHKNGSWLWVETTLTNMLEDQDVRALVVNFCDITQRKLTEDGLRRSEEQYRSLVAALDEGIVLMDKNGALVAANSSAERILGLTEEQIRARNMLGPNWTAVHEDGSPFDIAEYPIAVTLKTGQSLLNVVMGVLRPDGQLAWVSVNTQPLIRKGESLPYAVVASITDIAERLRAHAELQRSEEHYRLLFEHSFAGIARMTASGALVECNDALAHMFGCTSREKLLESEGSNFYFDLTERQRLFDELLKCGSLRNQEIKMKRLDGSTVWALVNASLLQTEKNSGEPLFEGVILDITERKLTEQKLEQLYEQSRALSARLETVREEERTHIAREIHDNLGQMMTGLKMDFSWLEKRMARLKDEKLQSEIKPKFVEVAKLLEDAIQTVRNIASDLRPGVLDTLGLRAAIDWQVREFKLKTEIKCSLKLCHEPKDLSQDHATALFRILQEILTNITRHANATQVNIEMTKTSNDIRLVVSDDGIGISEEQIRNPKSLGLLGMRERAMIYGGSVTVTSQANGGTSVNVRIPIKKVKPASSQFES